MKVNLQIVSIKTEMMSGFFLHNFNLAAVKSNVETDFPKISEAKRVHKRIKNAGFKTLSA